MNNIIKTIASILALISSMLALATGSVWAYWDSQTSQEKSINIKIGNGSNVTNTFISNSTMIGYQLIDYSSGYMNKEYYSWYMHLGDLYVATGDTYVDLTANVYLNGEDVGSNFLIGYTNAYYDGDTFTRRISEGNYYNCNGIDKYSVNSDYTYAYARQALWIKYSNTVDLSKVSNKDLNIVISISTRAGE